MTLEDIKAQLTATSHNMLEKRKELEALEQERQRLIGRMLQAEEMQKTIDELRSNIDELKGMTP